ncbi:double-strand break repair protein MRE11-like [Centruroides sculpturatus]|uniref:double-strand break repair protein MRE11-like n=1 Tax=Centruroides sculpturatus TaxID=218467 RepID=UPI000C6E716B|nr:double-strand break repair protein MRE11-like [Centruroides sculpturatus]
MSLNESNAPSHTDTLNILVATDCHLGYAEKDAIRGNDSFQTFEEILSIAKEKKVDFILLGGDLFHENKPSRKSLHLCLQLLRQYCLGDNPVQIEFLSDQSENFKHSSFPVVNYEDPNINISIPVFSIHGNHDDPAGQGSLCSADLLSVSGFINYFGKCTDLEQIQISPLLMRKGENQLALYGLGSIRDERLHRLFREGKVTMLRPRENPENWFNLFVLHQNRVKHGVTNYIPEQFLDDFLDLVIWGHEHECLIKPEWNTEQNFFVSQPGSSIATSLTPGEAAKKHVGLLQIHKRSFKMTKIPLQTVRQFYIEYISLNETGLDLEDSDITNKVITYCKEKVDSFLDRAIIEHTGNSKQPKKPLIRLRIEYSDNFETFNVQRFGQQYVEKVANPKDIIQFHRKKGSVLKKVDFNMDVMQEILKPELLDKSRVEDLVKEYFQQVGEKDQLSLLSEYGMSFAVHEFVEKEVKEAIQDIVTHQMNKTQTFLKSLDINDINDIDIDSEIQKYKAERLNSQDESTEISKTLEESRKKFGSISHIDFSDNEMEEDQNASVSSKRGRGRGRGRWEILRARGTKQSSRSPVRARGRGSRSVTNSNRNKFKELATVKKFQNNDSRDDLVRQINSRTRRTASSKRKYNYSSDDSD